MPEELLAAEAIVAWEMPGRQGGQADDDGIAAIARLAVALQNVAGARLSLETCLVRSGDDTCDILCGYETAEVAEQALELALGLAAAVLAHPPLRPEAKAVEGLRREVQRYLKSAPALALDQTTAAIVWAARARDIPAHRLSTALKFVRLGQGCRQRKLIETWTSNTPVVGKQITGNKFAAGELLRSLGIPMPPQIRVVRPDIATILQVAGRLGYPVAVKPTCGKKGIAVTPHVATARQLERLGQRLLAGGYTDILLERFIPGGEHRLLVVGGRLVGAARRIPASVLADGTSTVSELVAQVNRDPRRGTEFERVLVRLTLDEESDRVLAAQSLARSSVPAAGRVVLLRQTSNISTGGTGVDVTDLVHPEVREMAELAARAAELDIAGIDYITPDISRSYREVGGAVIEVNSCPGLRPHWAADGGRRDLLTPILEGLFPPETPSRIPTAVITGSMGKTTTSRMVQRILMAQGHVVGMVCTDGLYVQERLQLAGDLAGGKACQMLYNNPLIDAAVLETARGGLIKRGAGYDACDVAAVLNLADEHLGQDGIETLAQMAEVKAIVLRTARRAVVLNAADPLCLAMQDRVGSGCRTILFGRDPANPQLERHIRSGGTAVTVEGRDGDEVIVVLRQGRSHPVVAVSVLPAILGGLAPHNVLNALAATAVAVGLEIEPAAIARGLGGFRSDLEQNPGRLSFYEKLPFKVIIDLPVNSINVRALCRVVGGWPCSGRRILAMTAAGNRRNSHLEAMAAEAASHFDRFVLFSWADLRGRAPREVPEIFAAELARHGVAAERIDLLPDQAEAYRQALAMAGPGDIVVLHCPDNGRRRDALLHLLDRGAPFFAETYRNFTGGGKAEDPPGQSP